MKFSIVPEIINCKGIKFLDDRDISVIIGQPSNVQYNQKFQNPFFYIDTFSKKKYFEEDIKNIEIDELHKLGYILISSKATRRWFKKQKVIYRVESKNNRTPGAKRLKHVPSGHSIQKDIKNNRLRIRGLNAGFPHYSGEKGGHGPWIDLE